jgi:aryl-alcohol dehydrogenase-like predicted oxidoreductase
MKNRLERPWPLFKNQVTIAAKLSITYQVFKQFTDSRPEQSRRSAEGSLKRLRVEAIDL